MELPKAILETLNASPENIISCHLDSIYVIIYFHREEEELISPGRTDFLINDIRAIGGI